MARPLLTLLFLATIFAFASSARLLLEDDAVEEQPQALPTATANPAATTNTALPSGQIPAVVNPTAPAEEDTDEADPPATEEAAPAVPDADVAPPEPEEPNSGAEVAPIPAPAVAGTASSGGVPAAATSGSGTAAKTGSHEPTMSFFMHDVIGGSHPSARVVTGIIAETEINGIPFSKSYSNIFPVSGGTPLVNSNNLNKVINPNTAPLLTGFRGARANTIFQNKGTNSAEVGDGNLPFVAAGNLPPGSALQQLMFGTITVIDDELTEGHELGSAVIGRGQGFYLASSLDGTSQTIAMTILLHGEHEHDHYDEISLFGVHRTASHESLVAIVGGTGKYENAKGYATVETLNRGENVDHITDGEDTILHFALYLTE